MRLLLTLLATRAALAAAVISASTQFTKEQAKDGWIVVLKDEAPHEAFLHTRNLAAAAGVAPRYTFNIGSGSLRGHVVSGPGSEMAVKSMAESPHVSFIQPDTEFEINDFEHDTHEHDNPDSFVTEPTESWGLHRISHGPIKKDEPLEYRHHNATGRSGWVYILDTGITLHHPQFEGRAKWGATFLKDSNLNETWMPEHGDDNGHGTHCAGIIGGSTFGVAREANLVAVKIMTSIGNGHTSNFIRAIEWVIKDATKHGRLEKSVINLSIGGRIKPGILRRGMPDAVISASRIAAKKGIFVVAASGNYKLPVELYTPAKDAAVCTVSAIDQDDVQAEFNNYGPEVDLFAPGVDINSAWLNNGTKPISGSSMAAPFVSGLGAYFMDVDGPGKSTPGRKMCDRLISIASYRKGFEGIEAPPNVTDIDNNYTKVASNGWQSLTEEE